MHSEGGIMKITRIVKGVLATSMLTVVAAPAFAQDTPAPAEEAAPTAEDIAAQTAFLAAQVEALQAQIEALKKQVAGAAPSWKGAPQWADSGAGWSFKPKGFVQFDAGYVSIPGPTRSGTIGGLNYNNLGFDSRARRLVFGAEGTMPGGFAYKVEFNLAQGTVDYEDITLSWQKPGSPIIVTVGNMYPLSSLESMTSSRLGSMMERSQFTDAFVYNRRLGATLGYVNPTGDLSVTAGIFSTEINENPATFDRTGWQLAGRTVWSPKWGETQLHLGVNAQYRKAKRDIQNVQYRARPATQITDQRFVDTGLIAADGDTTLGAELAAIHGPIHAVAEAQKIWVRGYAPGKTFGANNGVNGAAFYTGDPSFWSAYGEVGFYLTGESRGYKGGRWDRTKVLHPVDQGGWGAFQINGRIDYVNLNDATGSGAALAAPNYVNGGRETEYQASLIWNPIDYIRLMAEYSRHHVNGGPRATTIDPSPGFALDKDYDFNSIAMRAQVEF
jgi:phosphate-selective porin OprO/OprP